MPPFFGAVITDDLSFPGFPTFPVIGKTHADIFPGVIPAHFVNQNADPFIHQLYWRFGAVRFAAGARLWNRIGGAHPARYAKAWAPRHWAAGLDAACDTVEAWLARLGPDGGSALAPRISKRLLALDVVVPSYSCDPAAIARFLALQRPPDCVVSFAIIGDDPSSEHIPAMRVMCDQPGMFDVRLRINTANLGAPAARNRGLDESSAEWVLFLDDDVIPEPDILLRYAEHIRDVPRLEAEPPSAAGLAPQRPSPHPGEGPGAGAGGHRPEPEGGNPSSGPARHLQRAVGFVGSTHFPPIDGRLSAWRDFALGGELLLRHREPGGLAKGHPARAVGRDRQPAGAAGSQRAAAAILRHVLPQNG